MRRATLRSARRRSCSCRDRMPYRRHSTASMAALSGATGRKNWAGGELNVESHPDRSGARGD